MSTADAFAIRVRGAIRSERSRRSRHSRAALGRVLACGLLVAAAGACQDGGLTLDEVTERGFLRAGYADEPPYAYVDSSGEVVGESPGALRAAVASAGLPDIQWVQLPFPELIPALRQGRVDVLAAGLYRTPEREASVRFTQPTSCSGPALVVSAENHAVRSLADVGEQGVRLAVLAGSVEEAAARAYGLSGERLVSVPDVRAGLVAVRRGVADALAVTAPTARYAAKAEREGDLEVVRYTPPADVEHLLEACSALAFRHEDRELADAIDAELSGVLKSPRRQAVVGSLGFTPPRPSEAIHGGEP